MIAAPAPNLWYTRRFYDDYRTLHPRIAEKVRTATRLVKEHGPYYPSLHTRTIGGNSDGRFRFMNVDDQYRIVAVLEGRDVLFALVGNHDETLKRGATAVFRELEERLAIDPETFVRRVRTKAVSEAPTLFGEQPASLPQIVSEPEVVADLITGDLFGALEGYRDGLLEDWMIFLSPLQRRAVERNLSGPARVTGGPGTGKTVVGLHRAKRLAENLPGPRRVLMTSFVRNIPETLDGLFERLAPQSRDRVWFRHIHELALDVLRTRNRPVRPDAAAARSRFDHSLQADPARFHVIRQSGFGPTYLWDEVTRIIEGRGLTDVDSYLKIERHGRKRPMQQDIRRLIWSVYEEYRHACDRLAPVLADFDWVLRLAYDALQEEETGQRFQAIVVDEAQDMTEMGLRFLLEYLEGGASGRLILIGDQAQRIYPGGFRLGDIGVDIRGRSVTLRESYRSTDEIMQAVAALGRALSAEDFGEDGLASLASSTVRRGQEPTIRRFALPADELDWIATELQAADDPDSIGLLLPSNSSVDSWTMDLKARDVSVVNLSKWSGRPVSGVKIGTYHRSKGLEFKRVILPGLDTSHIWRPDDEDALLLQGSAMYVAMSRARDVLDVTYSGSPSYLVELFDEYCQIETRTGPKT